MPLPVFQQIIPHQTSACNQQNDCQKFFTLYFRGDTSLKRGIKQTKREDNASAQEQAGANNNLFHINHHADRKAVGTNRDERVLTSGRLSYKINMRRRHTTTHGRRSRRWLLKLKTIYQSVLGSPLQAQISGAWGRLLSGNLSH